MSSYADLAPLVRNPADLGITEAMLIDLVLRRTLVDAKTSFGQLSAALGVTTSVAEALARDMREKKLVDFERMIGHDWVVVLTELGRAQASESMRRMTYVGTVPVNVEHYREVVRLQQERPILNREVVHTAYSDIVIDDRLVNELGPAMMGDGAMFLYGPPGTGKSTVAERLARMLGSPILIPRSIEIDSQVISVFDPTVHVPIDPQPEIDRRFVLCERPAIIVGGELERGQLDLAYDAPSGIHLAPVQLKANNGVLVIDDFGRQTMTPAELLNRWIVPMDRGIDYLTLNYGVRFHVPFDVRVAFSTNIDPARLGDEAFFRRIPNKVYIGSITEQQFDQVLQGAAAKRGIEYRADDAAYLRHLVRTNGDGDLRPYMPGVVCDMARAICQFEQLPVRLNRDTLDRVAAMYFTRSFGSKSDTVPLPGQAAAVLGHADSAPSAKDILEQWLAAQPSESKDFDAFAAEPVSDLAPPVAKRAPSPADRMSEWDKLAAEMERRG